MTLNLATILRTSACKHPDKPALVLGDKKLSYAQLDGMARKIAGLLNALDIPRGSNIALMLPNVPQFTACYFGTMYQGSAVVPMNVLLKSDEVAYHLDHSEAKAVIVWEGFVEHGKGGFEKSKDCKHLIMVPQDPTNTDSFEGCNFNMLLSNAEPVKEFAATSPQDVAAILYTSGTTGKPKGAELSHFNLFQNAQYMVTQMLPLSSQDTSLCVLPLFHTFAQTVVQNASIFVAGTIVLQPRFDAPQTLGLMQKHKVTFFAGVPTMYFGLLHYPKANDYDLSSLRFCVSGGSAMPVEVMNSFDKKYNVNILEGYGLSETSPIASFNMLDRPKKAGSVGVPIDNVDLKLIDDQGNVVHDADTRGEILIKGVNVMRGYHKDPEATRSVMSEDGWFATGDIAVRDEDGYYFIVDRKKDMINRGGLNVYPREIEEVLYKHEAIAEAAVIGVPDERLGEEVKAVVSFKPGKEATHDEIIDFVKSKIAAYKYPRSVEFIDSLPKGPTGKILKRELRSSK